MTDVTTTRRPTDLRALGPAALVSAAGFVVFGLEQHPAGLALLAFAVALALVVHRPLGKDLVLVALGLAIMSAVPITTDVSNAHMATMGTAMVLAVAVPYLVSRYVLGDHAIRFPVRTGERWTSLE